MAIEREQLDADVLIVGAGPAGLACALRLAQLASGDSKQGRAPAVLPENVYVLEKGREVGAHQLSGAIMDPRGLAELVPDFRSSAPIGAPVSEDAAYFLTETGAMKFPITPPPLRNEGNYVISLSRLTKWLAGLVEQAGVNVFTQFAGSQPIYAEDGIAGVVTDDKGLDKKGQPKPNFTPGYELRGKITVLAEGSRGSLTRALVDRYKLDGTNPQIYAISIKELWDVPDGRIRPGWVAHTMGWPLDSHTYGGGWIYGLEDRRVSVGLVVGLEYHDPHFDPHAAFQRMKTHPFIRSVLEGGKLVRYGAKSLPEGGWYSRPRPYVAGGLLIGDSASLLNSQRLKGIHIAIMSGILAAETIYDALGAGDTSATRLASFERRLEGSWIHQELWPVRNFHQGFRKGLWPGLFQAGLQMVTGGRGLVDPIRVAPGHLEYQKLSGNQWKPLERYRGDGALTFDVLTDLYHSGTRHDDDQPCHLHVLEPDICVTRCVAEYGNPCQYFCPAMVYEMVREDEKLRLKINAANCVHCKTCDIADPYQIIVWVPPEGGGGPDYEGM
ncbi:MAG TPA: electron transfer flavoprotein-ubiquinone oxidoreductase [Patescibacteria group bacterium]|nr:electron transfer flavoprotein-ubiquinone oxidoreductase [Patescibacteria group bacterium]